MQHGSVADRSQRHVANVLERPPCVVVRARIVGTVVLFAEVALRELSVRLIETHHIVAGRDGRTARLERAIGALHLDALQPEQVHEIGGLNGSRLIRGDDERIRPILPPAVFDSAHALAIELIEIAMPVAGHVIQRDEQRRLLIVDVVADAPAYAVDRRVRPEPFDRRLTVGQLHGMAFGATGGVRLVEAADRVVAVRHPEHVVRRPAVVEIVRPDAGQPATRERRDFLEGELVPLADDDGVELAIVGPGPGGRIEERHRLVQNVQHGGMPGEERLQHRPGQHL